jgi:hypothetical protein
VPAPRLVHPVSVQIEPLDRTASAWDGQAREQIPGLRRKATVTIQAQIHWSRLRALEGQPAGPVEHHDGHLVFLRADLERLSYAPGPGDRVAAIEGVTRDIYLTGNAQQRGQYFGRHHLVRCDFEDRGARRD